MGLARMFGLEADDDQDMARANTSKQALNTGLVASYVSRLRSAKADRPMFERVFADVKSDPNLRAGELVAIANTYAVAGIKATSKKAALEKISKAFLQIVRTEGNHKIAEKFRPW